MGTLMHAFLALFVVFSITLNIIAINSSQILIKSYLDDSIFNWEFPTITDRAIHNVWPTVNNKEIFKILNESPLFMFTALHHVLGPAYNLSNTNSSEKIMLHKYLNVRNISSENLNLVSRALSLARVKSKTVFYRKRTLRNKRALNFFQKSRIEIFQNKNELNAALESTIPKGNEINLHIQRNDQFLLNVISFHYDWLNNFHRGPLMHFVKSNHQKISTNFLTSKNYYEAYREEGEYMAVKLRFANRPFFAEEKRMYESMFMSTTTSDREKKYAREMLRKYTLKDIGVYLIGQSDPSSPLPEMTGGLIRYVNGGFLNRREVTLAQITFPAFNATWESFNLKIPQNNSCSQECTIFNEVETSFIQKTFLCVDEQGIQGAGESSKPNHDVHDIDKYEFTRPFYFLIVHLQTGVPIAVTYVDSVLEGNKMCSSGQY